MPVTPETIWKVPAYLPYLQPPLTKEAIAVAESKLGYTLPVEYLDLLRKQNGGYIRYSLPDATHNKIAGIGPYFPSLLDFDWDYCQEYVSFPLQGLVPFDGDGHWHLCLDYRYGVDAPRVTYVDVEGDWEIAVAVSFAEYLTKLQLVVSVDDVDVVEGFAEILQIATILSNALEIAFEPPDTNAHGYPIYRAFVGTKKNPEWIWITPNRVPRGFVRTDDTRYNDLKDLMQGEGLRFPEVPADACFISAPATKRPQLLNAYESAHLAVRSLRDYLQESS